MTRQAALAKREQPQPYPMISGGKYRWTIFQVR
jgi:hypothetical protein